MKKFAVVDTETTWIDTVMSVGVVIADAVDMHPVETAYFVLAPEFSVGGMYEMHFFTSVQASPSSAHEERQCNK